jgi:hypothetical protein
LLQAIRLQVIGHREHDAAVQVSQLEALDIQRIEQLGYDMLRWLNEFHRLTSGLWNTPAQQSG